MLNPFTIDKPVVQMLPEISQNYAVSRVPVERMGIADGQRQIGKVPK